MKIRNWTLLVAGLAFQLTASAAGASSVSFNATFDPTTPGVFSSNFINSQGTGLGFSGLAPAAVAVGDQVSIKYTFGGMGISASNVSTAAVDVWDWNGSNTFDAGPDETVFMTGTASLLNSLGQVIATSSVRTDSNGFIHIGQFQLNFATGPLLFYGILYNGTLTGASPADTRTYNLAALTISGSNFAVVATPLPAALPLFATGLAGLGLLGWRRKRKAAALAA